MIELFRRTDNRFLFLSHFLSSPTDRLFGIFLSEARLLYTKVGVYRSTQVSAKYGVLPGGLVCRSVADAASLNCRCGAGSYDM